MPHYIPPGLVWLTFAVIGACVGSFLNVLVYRLPKMLEFDARTEQSLSLSLSHPASHCPACQNPIAWYENIPLFSFIALRGKCSACKTAIAWRYPLVELVTAAVFVICALAWGCSWTAAAYAVFCATLLALALIDVSSFFLPDSLTQPLLWLGLLAVLLHVLPISLTDAVTGAIAGYLSLWLVLNGFKWLTRRDGMGQGDLKLFAAIGAWLGWQALVPVIFGAAFAGVAFGVGAHVLRRSSGSGLGQALPFGPFLAGSALVSLGLGWDWFYRLLA